MIEFEILTGMPTYTVEASPEYIIIPNGDRWFTPGRASLEILSGFMSGGIQWLVCKVVAGGTGRKQGSYAVTLHVNYKDIIILDIPIVIKYDRIIEEYEQSGTTSLKFVIDPLLSDEHFNLHYVLYAYNIEFNRFITGLNLHSGITTIYPGSPKLLQIQHVGILPGGQYSLEGFVADKSRQESKQLEIFGYSMLVDFGDGSDFILVNANTEIVHIYDEDGFYTITLYVDFDGAIAVFSRTIEVKGPLVVADRDWDTWWQTDTGDPAPHWIQVSF